MATTATLWWCQLGRSCQTACTVRLSSKARALASVAERHLQALKVAMYALRLPQIFCI